MRDESSKGEHELIHNPGYDFLRLSLWMEETNAEDPNLTFGSYLIPTIAILAACCAIEGYINMVGRKIDKDWEEFDKGPVPIKDYIARIYKLKEKPVDFGSGIWQQVINLFKARVSLVHPRYVEKTEKRLTKIPDLFDIVNSKYPPAISRQIAETAVSVLLADTNLSELRNLYHWRSYSGPPRH